MEHHWITEESRHTHSQTTKTYTPLNLTHQQGSSSATIKGEVTGANPPVTISDFYTALKVADASHPGFFQSLKQKK